MKTAGVHLMFISHLHNRESRQLPKHEDYVTVVGFILPTNICKFIVCCSVIFVDVVVAIDYYTINFVAK